MNRKKIKPFPRRELGLVLLTAIAILSSCVQREMEMRPNETESYVDIALKWEEDRQVQAVRYLFYDETGKLVKEESGLTTGFKGTLPAGKYRVLVHNTDAGQVDYRGIDRYETAEVFALETTYRDNTPGTLSRATTRPLSGMPCVLEPQMVFGAATCNEFDMLEVGADGNVQATITPRSLTRQMEFHFSIKGTDDILSLTGVLGNVAPSLFLATGKHNASKACAVEFSAAPTDKAESATQYSAQMTVFNLLTTAESATGTTPMTVTLTLNDGSRLTSSFDLTDALKEIIIINGGFIPIEIPVDVELEVKELGGLSATVHPWDDTGSGSGKPKPQADKQERP